MAIVRGFQRSIQDKITGFNAPLFISKAGSSHIFEAEAMDQRIPFLEELKKIPGIEALSPVAFKPLLLQSAKFSDTIQLHNGTDSMVNRQDMLGLMLKGVGADYDWSFVREHLIHGKLPRQSNLNEIVLSVHVAKQLNVQLNQEISAYHIKQQPLLKKLKVVGIYQTGFVEYDQKLVFGNLALVQQLSDYGTKISLRPKFDGKAEFLISVEVEGDASNLLFDWGLGKDIYTAHRFASLKDTTLKVFAYRYLNNSGQTELIDSAQMSIEAPGILSYRDLKLENGAAICLIDGASERTFATQKGPLKFSYKDGIGTSTNFISGFEVQINEFEQLNHIEQALKEAVEMRPVNQHLLQVSNIRDTESDLFSWLHFLDFNVLIIIILMLIIGIINVGSAILVLIVVRTSFVGLLKALGANNPTIRRIFLWQAAYLLLRGMLIGNFVAILIGWIQSQFQLVKLNPEVYYLDAVPVDLSVWNFILINLLTFCACMLALLLPTRVVSRISPVKALKFR
jgi:lipoprotein-releasing system permease protein